MKGYITVVLTVLLLFALSACHQIAEPTQPAVTPPAVTQPTETAPRQTDLTETEPANTEEIEAFQQLLRWDNRYNCALISIYATAADVNLYYFLNNGFPDESSEPTGEEFAYLDKTGKFMEDWENLDLNRLPTKKINAVLQQYFGLTLEETNKIGMDNFVYWDLTDCYYSVDGFLELLLTVTDVKHLEDGNVQVFYDGNQGLPHVVTLKPNGDGYMILSNMTVE